MLNHDSQNRFHFILAVLAAFTIPYNVVVNSIAVILLAAISIYIQFQNRIIIIRNPLFVLTSSIFLIAIFGLVFTSDFSDGFAKIQPKLGLIAFPFAFFTRRLSDKQIRTILIAFVISCSLFAVISQVDSLIRLSQTEHHNFSEHYFSWWYTHKNLVQIFKVHPSYAGVYVVFSLAVLFYWIPRVTSRFLKTVLIVAIIYLTFFSIQLAAKTSIFLLFVTIPIGIFHVANKSKQRVLGVFLVVFLMSTLTMVLINVNWAKDRINKSIQSFKDPQVETRFDRWSSAYKVIQENWLFGVGTGDSNRALIEAYGRDNLVESAEKQYNTHNEFIDYLLSFGLVGFLLLLGNVLFSWYIAIKEGSFLFALFTFYITVFFMFENVLSTQKGVIFFALFNSLFLSNLCHLKRSS